MTCRPPPPRKAKRRKKNYLFIYLFIIHNIQSDCRHMFKLKNKKFSSTQIENEKKINFPRSIPYLFKFKVKYIKKEEELDMDEK
jgi:hypothetical protein